jgi:hypothetical protein
MLLAGGLLTAVLALPGCTQAQLGVQHKPHAVFNVALAHTVIASRRPSQIVFCMRAGMLGSAHGGMLAAII